MARRGRGIHDDSIGVAILVALPILAVVKITDAIGTAAFVITLLALIAAFVLYRGLRRAKRVAYLRAKYKNEAVVRSIMDKGFWQGQTVEQLHDSLGSPAAVDNVLLKTRKREVWKYQRSGTNRYRLRITLDNDIVVSWDQKN